MERIYAVHGRNGLTKIGRTKDWGRRLGGLRYHFKKLGDEVARFDVFGPVEDGANCEFAVMHAMKQEFESRSGYEWFHSDDFNLALAIVEEVVVNQSNAERYNKTTAGQRKLAEAAAERQSWIDKRAAVKAERQQRRNAYLAGAALRREQKAHRATAPMAMVVSCLMAQEA